MASPRRVRRPSLAELIDREITRAVRRATRAAPLHRDRRARSLSRPSRPAPAPVPVPTVLDTTPTLDDDGFIPREQSCFAGLPLVMMADAEDGEQPWDTMAWPFSGPPPLPNEATSTSHEDVPVPTGCSTSSSRAA